MARKPMPINTFVKQTVDEAFAWSEGHFGPITEENRKNFNFMHSQIVNGPPIRFLELLETTEEPKGVIEEAVARLKAMPPPIQILFPPGEFTKDRLLEYAAMQAASHIINVVFSGPESGSRFSSLNQDIKKIYVFLKQKYESALADSPNGQEVSEESLQLYLQGDEKPQLIAQYSNAIFSIHLLIRRISKPDANYGQYL